VAEPPDDSRSKTLEPELNPILNPLLAAYMGRWAEVYFTSPPESREQAVADLLRELAGEYASPHISANVAADANQQIEAMLKPEIQAKPQETANRENAGPESADHRSADQTAGETKSIEYRPEDSKEAAVEIEGIFPQPGLEEPAQGILVCETCGHLNGDGQNFCSMCGRSLTSACPSPSEDNEPSENGAVRPLPVKNYASEISFSTTEPERRTTKPPTVLPMETSFGASRVSDRDESDENNELFASSAQKFEDRPQPIVQPTEFAFQSFASEPHARSYRLYIALTIILLLVVFVFATWRNNSRAGSGPVAPEIPVPTQELAPAPAPGNSSSKSVEDATERAPRRSNTRTDPREEARTKPSSTAEASSHPVESKSNAQNPREAMPQPVQHSVAAPATPQQPPAAINPNGGEELAHAEEYLRSGPAGARQAVPWLWKAVAKENPTAAVMLSDLYLRGEGVSKNCDQARLLLDAAARKGETAAAERIRNLQSYGCR
jgi:rubrerythrin